MATYTTQNRDNVIYGAAALFVSEEDSTEWTAGEPPALPTFAANVSAAVALDASADFRNVGFTQEGAEIAYEPTYTEIEVDQVLDALKRFKTAQSAMLTTTLAESTLENLLVVWGQPRRAAGTLTEIDLEVGALGEEPTERSLVLVGPAPRAAGVKKERVFHITRAIQTESSSLAMRKTDPTVLPASFRFLPDVTQSRPRYGRVIERTIT